MPQTSLEKWLEFNDDEMQILEWVRRLGASSSRTADLVDAVKIIDLSLALKFSIKYPELDAIFKHPDLVGVWDQTLQLTNFPAIAHFKFIPQPTIHSLDLLKGLFLYGNYKRRALSKDEQDQHSAMQFLELSAEFGCYLALNMSCKLQLKKIRPNIELVLRTAEKTANLYLAPGYLLLAVCNYSFKLNLDALKCLVLTEKLIPYSVAYLHNAYFGRSIDEIIGASFGDINTGKVTLAKLANIPLSYLTHHFDHAMEERKASILGSLAPVVVRRDDDKLAKLANIPLPYLAHHFDHAMEERKASILSSLAPVVVRRYADDDKPAEEAITTIQPRM